MKTHKILDIIRTEDEGQECFIGTYVECYEWTAEQGDFGYVVVPMTKAEIEENVRLACKIYIHTRN